MAGDDNNNGNRDNDRGGAIHNNAGGRMGKTKEGWPQQVMRCAVVAICRSVGFVQFVPIAMVFLIEARCRCLQRIRCGQPDA
jgi:hypothetical protein